MRARTVQTLFAIMASLGITEKNSQKCLFVWTMPFKGLKLELPPFCTCRANTLCKFESVTLEIVLAYEALVIYILIPHAREF